MAYHLSFQEYLDLNEAGLLKKWQNRIMGRDEDGKSGVATAHALRHKDDAVAAGNAAGSFVGNVASLAGNVASGNVVGAATSIWGMISDAVKGGSKAYTVTKAGMYILEVRKHMADLKKHLIDNEQLEEETADAIIDAVFEVDGEIFDDVSPGAWAEGTKRFAAGLAQGYENINEKIFAAVMAQVIKEWVEKMGGKVEGLKDAIAKLRGEKKQKIDFLEEPEIAQAMAEFDPPRVHKDLEDEVKQPAAGTPRTLPQVEAALVKAMGWPKMPRDGDEAIVMYRGENHGPITFYNTVGERDIRLIKSYGWDEWLDKWVQMYGYVTTKFNTQYGPYKPQFGSDYGKENLPEWDATQRLWICHSWNRKKYD